jgi:hypothetical protein
MAERDEYPLKPRMSLPDLETGMGAKPWETSIRRARFAYRPDFSLAPTTATIRLDISTLLPALNCPDDLVEALEEAGTISGFEGSRPSRQVPEFAEVRQEFPACEGFANAVLGEHATRRAEDPDALLQASSR